MKATLSILLFIFCSTGYAQIGGKRGFEFLNIPVSARPAATGGVNVSSYDGDVTMILQNPALMDSLSENKLGFNYTPYLADISNGSLVYAQRVKNTGLWGVGLQYINYGDFKAFDQFENELPKFSANEFAFSLIYANQIELFTFGVSAKLVTSQIHSYQPTALTFDLSTAFKHPSKDIVATVVFKNLGLMLSSHNLSLPTDVRLGVSVKPDHMPIRISITAYNLLRNNITYYNQSVRSEDNTPSILNKLFKHFAFGVEFVINKNINLRGGYNHLVRESLSVKGAGDLAGFSYGFLIRVKKIDIAYTRASYHISGGSHYFTLMYNLDTLLNKK